MAVASAGGWPGRTQVSTAGKSSNSGKGCGSARYASINAGVAGNCAAGNGLAGFTIHAHHPGGEDVSGNKILNNAIGIWLSKTVKAAGLASNSYRHVTKKVVRGQHSSPSVGTRRRGPGPDASS